jgi:hypothetical protein
MTETTLLAATYLYLFYAYTLQRIGEKTGTDGVWMAWFPGLNVVYTIRIAGRSLLWLLYLSLPGVNWLLYAFLWGEIAAARGKPPAVAALLVVAPVATAIALFALGQPLIVATLTSLLAALAVLQGLLAFSR